MGSLWDETRDTATHFSLLEKVSHRTGGQFVRLENLKDRWFKEVLDPLSWSYEQKKPLWDSPWILLAFIILLFAEWTLRRRAGGI